MHCMFSSVGQPLVWTQRKMEDAQILTQRQIEDTPN